MTNVYTSAEPIGEDLVSRMEGCTIEQGAETDIGRRVYRGLRKIDDDLIPCSVLIEAPDVVRRKNVRQTVSIDQGYVLLAYVPCDPLNPNVAAHAALRDLKRAVFTTNGQADSRLGGRVEEVEYKGRDIGPRADGGAFVCVAIELGVHYAENLGLP